MRLAIDVRSLIDGRISGVEIYTGAIIQALARRARPHQLTLFYNAARVVAPPRQTAPNLTTHAWHFPNKLFNTAQLLTGQPRWDALLTADVFFVPNMRLMPLKGDTPLVVTAHDLSFERFPEFYSRHRRLWHRAMRPRRLMQRANCIIAVSHHTAADITELYDIPPERIRVIYSGVTPPTAADLAPAQQQLVKTKHQLTKPFILFIGTLEPRKNVTSIIEAFTALADDIPHDLVIAGSPGWLESDSTRSMRASPAASRIHHLGFIEPADKYPLLAAADLFVYPSFYEGFGFPPLEALLAGTPVITSNTGALPEVVGEWATLINPYQPGELALVMQELLEHPPHVTESTKQAIREKYSWDRAAKETLRVLESVV